VRSYKEDSHFRKRDTDAQRVDSALLGWAQGVETLEAGDADESIEGYLWALDCRDALEAATTTAGFKQRAKVEARLPELDRRFKAGHGPDRGMRTGHARLRPHCCLVVFPRAGFTPGMVSEDE